MSSLFQATMTMYTFTFLALLIIAVNAAPDYTRDLYAGSRCQMEDGGDGKCILITKCPMRLREVKAGIRNSNSGGRCGFENFIEIVCCPLSDVEGNLPIGPQVTTNSPTVMRSSTEIPVTRPIITPSPAWTMPTPVETTSQIASIDDDFQTKLGLRPADVACHVYEKQIQAMNNQSKQQDPTSERNGLGGRMLRALVLDEEVNPWIFGGDNATEGEFPYMVALGYSRNKNNPNELSYSCGGSLISDRHVLTAAHCVSNVNNEKPVEVKLGAINLNDNSDRVQNIKVLESIAHPQYKRSLNYFDIAILRLERSAIMTRFVRPVCLQTKPPLNLNSIVNTSLIVTGWGSTSFENEGTNILQKTPSLQYVERLECANHYKKFSKLPQGVDDSMICVLDRNVTRRSDACQGDSGGPLLYSTPPTNTVLGVTSFGQSCGSSIPAIYTNVYFFLDWIEDIVWPNRKRALSRISFS